jgi:predicted ferric reductase
MAFKAKIYVGPILVVGGVVVPLVLGFVFTPLSGRFDTFEQVMTNLGRAAGIFGMALYAISLILSARFKVYTEYFPGLNKEYNYHHTTGIYSFLLLMAHPILLDFRYLYVSPRAMADFLLPRNDIPILLGMIALLGLVALILVTLYAKWKYHILKGFHKFLGVVFFVAAAHMFLSLADLGVNLPLAVYMAFLTAGAAGAFFYRTILGAFAVDRLEGVVTAVTKSGPDVIEISITFTGDPMMYRSGQFVFVSFESSLVSFEAHPFSVSSGGDEVVLRVAIKALGDYTKKLLALETGKRALVEGPFGRFFYEYESTRDKVWVAGGIGITPFLSMARTLSRTKTDTFKVYLFYCTKNVGELCFIDELNKIALEHDWLTIIPYCADTKGFLTGQKVAELANGVIDKDLYVCGPPMLMQSLRKQFLRLGASRKSIHLEAFKLL